MVMVLYNNYDFNLLHYIYMCAFWRLCMQICIYIVLIGGGGGGGGEEYHIPSCNIHLYYSGIAWSMNISYAPPGLCSGNAPSSFNTESSRSIWSFVVLSIIYT